MEDNTRPPSPEDPQAGSEGTKPETPAVDEGRRAVSALLWRVPVLLAVGGGAYGMYEAYRVHFDKKRPDPSPTFAPVPATDIAPLSAFAREWDGVHFELPRPQETPEPATVAGARYVPQATLPAVALRLPGPIPGGLELVSDDGLSPVFLAAFSRICTHLGCTVEFNTDLAAINFGFNYGTDHPALTCPCHLSVFDPSRSGRAVSGPAVRPLPRVGLSAQDGRLWAVGLERD